MGLAVKELTRLLRNIPNADDEKPFVRRLVNAADAAPVQTNAPSSVFDLASRPVPKRRRPLTLRDLDLVQTPLPIVCEVPPETFNEALGLIDSEAE